MTPTVGKIIVKSNKKGRIASAFFMVFQDYMVGGTIMTVTVGSEVTPPSFILAFKSSLPIIAFVF